MARTPPVIKGRDSALEEANTILENEDVTCDSGCILTNARGLGKKAKVSLCRDARGLQLDRTAPRLPTLKQLGSLC